MGRGLGKVQRYVLDFVEAATDAGCWAVTRRSVVLARGEGLSARDGAQRYVRDWRDLLGISDDPQRWRMESMMHDFRLEDRGLTEPRRIWLVATTDWPPLDFEILWRLGRTGWTMPGPKSVDISDDARRSRGVRSLTRETTHLRRSQTESTVRAIRALVRSGRLETHGRGLPVSIAGMLGAYEAASVSRDLRHRRYVQRYGRPLPPHVQKQYEQELHDAFQARRDRLRAAAQPR